MINNPAIMIYMENIDDKVNVSVLYNEPKEYIEIKEIWYFEKFLRQRFQFEQVHIKIKYAEGVRKKPIADEWENIVCLMAHKYPLMKPLLLLKSQIEVTENQINVYMKIQGADFLKARIYSKHRRKNKCRRSIKTKRKSKTSTTKSNRKCNERSNGSTKNGSRKTSTK